MKRNSIFDKTFVNQSFAAEVKEEKRTKLGKNYWEIDFEIDNFPPTYTDEMPTIGTLAIGKNKIALTPSECNKVIDTLKDALNLYNNMVKHGKLQ
jgi:hypothetical protein